MHIRVILGRRSFACPRGLRVLLDSAGVVVPIADLSMTAVDGLTAARQIAEHKSDGRAAAADTAQKRRQHSPPSTDAT